MSAKFSELAAAAFAGTTVVLDVDGTLLPDGREKLSEGEDRVLRELASCARVYLCSNAFGAERTKALAHSYGVRFVPARYKKPDPGLMGEVEASGDIVVIGDKYLTDGLLAGFTRSAFMKVRSLRSSPERLLVRAAYLLDALAGKSLLWLVRTLRPL